jgi:hypothetical protein
LERLAVFLLSSHPKYMIQKQYQQKKTKLSDHIIQALKNISRYKHINWGQAKSFAKIERM